MTPSNNDRVLLTVKDGVAEVCLNRPDKLNALDSAMFDALIATGEHLRTLAGLRAVVLTGAGRSFCAGLDMERFQAMAGGSDSAASLRLGPRARRARAQRAALGAALGGGLQIALGADIRIVAPDVKLGLLEIRWGIIPDMGAFVVLPELMPADRIRELTYTGRTFSGTEAVAIGLATRTSDTPLDDARAMAADIASKNPDAVRASKALIASAPAKAQAAQLLRESEAQIAIMNGSNQREAVRAQLEKRPARFVDPI